MNTKNLFIGLFLGLGVCSIASAQATWWWQKSGTSNSQNTTSTVEGSNTRTNATGTNVQLNTNLSAQPPMVVLDKAGGGGPAVTTGTPGIVNFSVTVTDGRTTIARNTTAVYTYTITNLGSTSQVARIVTFIGASRATTAPQSVASISCGATPSCSVVDANTAQITIPAGASVTVTRSALMANAASYIQASGHVFSAVGHSDVAPANNTAMDGQSVT